MTKNRAEASRYAFGSICIRNIKKEIYYLTKLLQLFSIL